MDKKEVIERLTELSNILNMSLEDYMEFKNNTIKVERANASRVGYASAVIDLLLYELKGA